MIPEGLELHILNGQHCPSEEKFFYGAAYELWENVWTSTFKELEGSDRIFSDDFTRQDEILCLFIKGKCIALICHRFADIHNPAILKDSYFKAWPELALRKLASEGSRIVIGSQISIHPDFRGKASSFRAKEFICYLSFRHLSRKNVDAISGTVRADKGVHNIFYDCGAEPIVKNVMFHNVPVDLVAFFPKKRALRIPKSIENEVDNLLKKKGAIEYAHVYASGG